MPALFGVLALAVLLLSSGGASAAPRQAMGQAMGHAMPGHAAQDHAAHRHAASQHAAQTAVAAVVLSMPDGGAPCHHGQDRTLPPCCVGVACVAMPVGLAAETLPAPEPGRGDGRPTGSRLPEGVGVPPDLPPPRLG